MKSILPYLIGAVAGACLTVLAFSFGDDPEPSTSENRTSARSSSHQSKAKDRKRSSRTRQASLDELLQNLSRSSSHDLAKQMEELLFKLVGVVVKNKGLSVTTVAKDEEIAALLSLWSCCWWDSSLRGAVDCKNGSSQYRHAFSHCLLINPKCQAISPPSGSMVKDLSSAEIAAMSSRD